MLSLSVCYGSIAGLSAPHVCTQKAQERKPRLCGELRLKALLNQFNHFIIYEIRHDKLDLFLAIFFVVAPSVTQITYRCFLPIL